MAKALVFLAEGFEEIEAITLIDVLRRANVAVTCASLSAKRVTGAHGIVVEAECLLSELATTHEARGQASAFEHFDAMVLPGGMPGSEHLRDDARVKSLITQQAQNSGIVAAICAAPIALEAAGILRGRVATSYPNVPVECARYSEERVVVDGNIMTSRGPGTALEFALALVERLVGAEKARELRTAMVVAA